MAIFRLFDEAEEWTLDEVMTQLRDQPTQPVKKALEDVCNVRGRKYTLKDSYQSRE
jgi:hypothetical protein